jgi:hypothetical protein
MNFYDFSKVLDLVARKQRLLSLLTSPWFTNQSLEIHNHTLRSGASRRRRTTARGGEQMAGICNWAYHEPIGGGGMAGGGSGERRRRDHGRDAVHWILAREGAMCGDTQLWELHWDLGKVLEGLADDGSLQRSKLTAAAAMAGNGCVHACGRKLGVFYRRERQWGCGRASPWSKGWGKRERHGRRGARWARQWGPARVLAGVPHGGTHPQVDLLGRHAQMMMPEPRDSTD